MRRLLLAAVSLFFVVPSWGAVAFVRTTGPFHSNTTTVSMQFDQLVTIGQQVHVWGYCGGTNVTLSVANTGTAETFTPIITNQPSTSPGHWNYWVVYSSVGGVDTYALTASATCSDLWIAGAVFTGTAAAGYDQGPGDAVGLTSGSVTPTTDTQLLIALHDGAYGSMKPTISSPWTQLGNGDTGGHVVAWGYQIRTSCGPQSATFTDTGNTTSHSSILTFKGAGGSACSAGSAVRRRVVVTQ